MLSMVAAAPQAFATPSFVVPMRSPLANLKMQEAVAVEPEPEMPPAPFDGVAFAKTLPGVTDPLGYFDPMGFISSENTGLERSKHAACYSTRAARVCLSCPMRKHVLPILRCSCASMSRTQTNLAHPLLPRAALRAACGRTHPSACSLGELGRMR